MATNPRIVDLSMPIRDHFRWPVESRIKGDLRAGDQYRITRLGLSVHSFTHVDGQNHMLADGSAVDAVPLERVVGDCAVVDLSDVQPEQAIDGALLAQRGGHIRPGDRVLLRSCWDRQRDPTDAAFWRDAPYLTRDAAEWLLGRGIVAIAYDFPQDYPIRLMLDGKTAPFEEHVTHDVLLRNGVTMIEYLVNTAELRGERTFLVAAPLLIPGADGAPARVFAMDGVGY